MVSKLTYVNNNLVLARSNFSVAQKRVIGCIIEAFSPVMLRNIDKSHGVLSVKSAQLDAFNLASLTFKANYLNGDTQNRNYGNLRKALLDLRDKNVFIETVDKEIGTAFLLSFVFEEGSEDVKLLVDERFYKFLIDYNKKIGYTVYETSVLLSLGSIYAMKMYELLAKWRNVTSFKVELSELRRVTDTMDKYAKNNDFKTNVLDYAKKALDVSVQTDLRFDYVEYKIGKQIEGFKIFVYKTKNAHDYMQVEKVSLLWDFGIDIVSNLKKYNLDLKGKNLELVKDLKDLLGESELLAEMERLYFLSREVANPQGYMIKSLQVLKKTYEKVKEPQSQASKIPSSIGDLFSAFVDQNQ